ncbi:chloride channel protein [Streptomyces coryli]|uniref:chloride channel protein n=1 Tax=Streptomyces coryli TaxID=1128680 RepID=UPI0030B89835
MSEAVAAPPQAPGLREILLSPGYRRLLLLSALAGVPIALLCFAFVSLQHAIQHGVWEHLPAALGYDRAPWWWPLPTLLLAGLILAPVVTRLPGGGGHVPVHGLGGPPVKPVALPGVIIAALATLPLGVVLGPEAPLMALGSGLALLFLQWVKAADRPETTLLFGTAGSTTAISTILGGPLAAALMVVEGAGLVGPRLVALLLPTLTASGVGALVFTGFGRWTGLGIGSLELPSVPPDVQPDAGDFLWGLPIAAVVALVVSAGRRLGFATLAWAREQTAVRTVAAAVAAGGCLAAYALITGRTPEDAALSGQAGLGELAAHPHALPVATLIALVVCKGLAWGLCLGAMRGGPIFPAVLLGAAIALACAGLPGFGATPALAVGIAAAAVTVTGLAVTSAVLAALLLGADSANQMPLIVLSTAVALVVAQLVRRGEPPEPTA